MEQCEGQTWMYVSCSSDLWSGSSLGRFCSSSCLGGCLQPCRVPPVDMWDPVPAERAPLRICKGEIEDLLSNHARAIFPWLKGTLVLGSGVGGVSMFLGDVGLGSLFPVSVPFGCSGRDEGCGCDMLLGPRFIRTLPALLEHVALAVR